MMYAEYDITGEMAVEASYYYAVDRMYDVRYLLDATGAIVESYSYDPYGRPLIRECAGAGDMTGDSVVDSEDWDRFVDAYNCDIFDPRTDIDGDGVVGFPDDALFDVKAGIWDGASQRGLSRSSRAAFARAITAGWWNLRSMVMAKNCSRIDSMCPTTAT